VGLLVKKKKSAFTLIEIIIALGVLVIVLGIVNSIFITGNKVFSDSDVKTTLQMERQAIQEKISDIGMQATTAQAVTIDSSGGSNEINSITINSYDKDGNLRPFTIEKQDSGKVYKNGDKIYNLRIDGELVSSNIKNVMLDNNTITAANTNTLKNISSIKFNITLMKENGYSNVEQPIDFGVAFRNK
jgi:prepilin-type N-terminal cleavage/methylation domain